MKKKQSLARVTSVLSACNAEWYRYWIRKVGVEEAERITLESQIFGRNVHKLIENWLADKQDMPPTREGVCAAQIIHWLTETKAKPLYVEQELVDKKLGLIGHSDLICEINGHNYLVDFKTGKAMKAEMPLQLAAYSYMAENQYKIKIDNGVILRTPKDPEAEPQFEVQEYHNLRKKYWPLFKMALTLYKYFKTKGK